MYGWTLHAPDAAKAGFWFFVAFWLVTGAAVILAERPGVRRGYLVLFLVAMGVPGVAGHAYWLWPLQTWHLWGGVLPKQAEFFDLHVEDARGRRLLYDSRAVPPLLPTQVHLLAGTLLRDPSAAHRQELAAFLLERANAQRLQVLAGRGAPARLACPTREFGYTWTAAQLAPTDPFVRVVARHAVVTYADGGRRPAVGTVREVALP